VSVELTAAVPIRRSVTDDYIVCLECGKKLKMRKRHLLDRPRAAAAGMPCEWGQPR
jgi:predicted transcriptional regulator